MIERKFEVPSCICSLRTTGKSRGLRSTGLYLAMSCSPALSV
jgi:hypothetical protein